MQKVKVRYIFSLACRQRKAHCVSSCKLGFGSQLVTPKTGWQKDSRSNEDFPRLWLWNQLESLTRQPSPPNSSLRSYWVRIAQMGWWHQIIDRFWCWWQLFHWRTKSLHSSPLCSWIIKVWKAYPTLLTRNSCPCGNGWYYYAKKLP